MPMHKDTLEEQNAQLPTLSKLPPAERAVAAAKQPLTDEQSLLQWCRAHAVIIPAALNSLTALLAGMTAS